LRDGVETVVRRMHTGGNAAAAGGESGAAARAVAERVRAVHGARWGL